MNHRDWLLLDGLASDGCVQTQDDPMVPWLFSIWNCIWEIPSHNKRGVNKVVSGKGRCDFTAVEQLGKVINQVTKFVQERVPFPLGEQIHEFLPGDQVWVKDWKDDSLTPHWKGPYTVVLTTPMAVKVAGVTPPESTTWGWREYTTPTQKTLSGLCRGMPLTLERLRSSLRRRRKRRSWTSPLRMKPHNQLLLLGLINVILNLTSVSTQDNVFISWIHSYADFHNTSNCCICGARPLWRMVFLGECHHSTKEILNHSALFWDDEKRLSFLLSIIISPCCLGVSQTYSQ